MIVVDEFNRLMCLMVVIFVVHIRFHPIKCSFICLHIYSHPFANGSDLTQYWIRPSNNRWNKTIYKNSSWFNTERFKSQIQKCFQSRKLFVKFSMNPSIDMLWNNLRKKKSSNLKGIHQRMTEWMDGWLSVCLSVSHWHRKGLEIVSHIFVGNNNVVHIPCRRHCPNLPSHLIWRH